MQAAAPPPTLIKAIKYLDSVAEWSGKTFSWLIIPMAVILTYEVVSRYGFDAPTVWASQMATFLYGAHFMLGAAYTLLRGSHIRTDIFYNRWSPRVQGAVDGLLYIVFFFPGMSFFLIAGLDESIRSWQIGERSIASAAWQPPLWPLKQAIPATAALLMIQGISELVKCGYAVARNQWIGRPTEAEEEII